MTAPTPRDLLAEVIWNASRADEGTISATGANVVADAILASPALDVLVAERVAALGFWDRLGVDGAGMPLHRPMGVTAEGQGPTNDSEAHHFACWCDDAKCPLTQALALTERRPTDD